MSFIKPVSTGVLALATHAAEPDHSMDELTVSVTKIATPLLDAAAR